MTAQFWLLVVGGGCARLHVWKNHTEAPQLPGVSAGLTGEVRSALWIVPLSFPGFDVRN